MLSYNSLATNYQLQVCQKRWEGSYWVAHETTKKNQSPQFDNRSPPLNPFSSSWPSCCAEVSCGAHKRSYGLPGEKRRDEIRFSDHHTIHRTPVCCIV